MTGIREIKIEPMGPEDFPCNQEDFSRDLLIDIPGATPMDLPHRGDVGPAAPPPPPPFDPPPAALPGSTPYDSPYVRRL